MSTGSRRIVAQRLETVLGVPLSAPKHIEKKATSSIRAPGQSEKMQANPSLTGDGGRNSVEKVLPHSNANRSVAAQAQAQARAHTFGVEMARASGQGLTANSPQASAAQPSSSSVVTMSPAAKVLLDLIRLSPPPAQLDLGQISTGQKLKALSRQLLVQVIHQALRQNLVRSGVFYESSMSKTLSKQTLQALHQTPQASAINSIDLNEPATQGVVRHQAELLSGSSLALHFMLDESFYAAFDAKNGDVMRGDDEGERRGSVSLKIDHPTLGLIEVAMKIVGDALSVNVKSEEMISPTAKESLSDAMHSILELQLSELHFMSQMKRGEDERF